MTIRTRKFFGAIALIVLAAVWALVGMAVAQMPWLAQSGLLQAIFYVVAQAIAWLGFREKPTTRLLLGGALMIAGGLVASLG